VSDDIAVIVVQEKRSKILYIRCTELTKKRFEQLREEVNSRLGFKTSEDFLNYLLDLVEVLLSKRREEIIRSY